MQGKPVLALLSVVVEPGLPEIRLFQDQREHGSGLHPVTTIASRIAALPIPKSRQYLVSLSLFDLSQENHPASVSKVRRDLPPLPLTNSDDTLTIPESLALRFLGGFPGQLFPKQLPPHLPLQFPVPPSAELIGSWVMDRSGIDETNNILLFNIPQPVETVQEFYASQGQALGWSRLISTDMVLSHVGFLDTPSTFDFDSMNDGEAHTFLCDRVKGTEIVLQTYATSPTTTELRADIRPDSTNCTESDEEREEDVKLRESFAAPRKQIPIPILVAPADTQVKQGSESSITDYYAQSAQIKSKTLDAIALSQHYETQLQEQGWRSQARYVSELMRWSYWRLTVKKLGGCGVYLWQ